MRLINSHFGGRLLLDSREATAAYSLRQLRTEYAGPSVRVRRSSDNTEQDFGFASGSLDTDLLLAFCGSGDGFVRTLYDQTVNGNHQQQPSEIRQPRIVAGGSLVTSGGMVAWSDLGARGFADGLSIAEAEDYSFFAVQQLQDSNSNFAPRWLDIRSIGQGYVARTSSTNTIYAQTVGDLSNLSADFPGMFSQNQATVCGSGGSSGSNAGDFHFRANGSTLDANFQSRSASTICLGGLISPGSYNALASVGYRQEMIFFSADMTSSESSIETNQMNYWGVS